MLRKMRILVVEDEICQQARLTRSLSDCLSGRREKKLTVYLDRQGATSIRHWLKSALRQHAHGCYAQHAKRWPQLVS